MATSSTSETPTPGAVRLIFEYEGDTVRLISQQPVQMAVTTPDTTGIDHPGYYVDVRNSAGRALARVPAHAAFAASAEVFPERPGEPITRVDVPNPKGAFTVVVPVTDEASLKIAGPSRTRPFGDAAISSFSFSSEATMRCTVERASPTRAAICPRLNPASSPSSARMMCAARAMTWT